MKHLTLTVTLVIAASAFSGCAGSNASRAMFDSSQSLSLTEMNSAAQRLVTDIVANKGFARFKDRAGTGEYKEVTVILRTIENRTGENRDNDISYQEQLFDQLEERFAENDVRMRLDRVVLGSSKERDDDARQSDERVRALKQVKGQDADDEIDQGSGDVLTGATSKATLVMDLVIYAKPRSSDNKREWELRAKLYQADKATLLLSASSQPKADDR